MRRESFTAVEDIVKCEAFRYDIILYRKIRVDCLDYSLSHAARIIIGAGERKRKTRTLNNIQRAATVAALRMN